jgi:ATP-dependent DNA helicase RecG
MINTTIIEMNKMLENTLYMEHGEYKRLKYPVIAIKEIIVNAIIHRDYSLNDDIHIIIYDDRIEIKSPGKLPGYITSKNIYDERFSRNPVIVRLLHKLPNPPNHDIGEGLDTAKNQLHQVGLVPPEIEDKNNAVIVTIRHTRIASLEKILFGIYHENLNERVTNKMLRQASGENDINKVKKTLQRFRSDKLIEVADANASVFKYEYVITEAGKEYMKRNFDFE